MTGISRYSGKHVLVVEDDYFIAQEMVSGLETRGAIVVGPASGVERALVLIHGDEAIDVAILDINLNGEMVFPVADLLLSQHIPFVFATGYDDKEIPIRYRAVPRFFKPVRISELEPALFPSE